MRDGTAITMDDLSRAVCGSAETVSGTILVDNLLDLFRESTMQSVMALMHDIENQAEAYASDSEVVLTFLKSEYMLDGYIRTLSKADLEHKCIKGQ